MNFLQGEHISYNLSHNDFENLAIEIFRFQAKFNPIYAKYIEFLRLNPNQIRKIDEIPFLPIELFKNHRIITKYHNLPDEKFTIFRSSGTTSIQRSTHYIYNINIYKKSLVKGFELFYGDVKQYVILALLPSYIERGDSSLVFMVKKLMDISAKPENGFYLYNYKQLYEKLIQLKDKGQKTLLIGVSFALLEFARYHRVDFPQLIVMETGGMKGRGKEMVREQLHGILRQAFGVEKIHSEYGMTELLSQAYSKGEGIFRTPPWMKVLTRDINDPFEYITGRSGGINVIDLANVYSCAFVETKDIGRLYPDGSFEVLGRFDNSDLRGCNLMVS